MGPYSFFKARQAEEERHLKKESKPETFRKDENHETKDEEVRDVAQRPKVM